MTDDNNTEQKILDAAESIFQQKGFDGTRMQEIADEAGINKGLLHYYFKTKEKLFEGIFALAINRMIVKVTGILELKVALEEKINLIVDQYMTLLLKHPGLPMFVVGELNKNADRFIVKHMGKDARLAFNHFVKSAKLEMDDVKIRKVDPRHLFMNLMAMMIFPFIGRPLLQTVAGMDNAEFKNMMTERREHIKDFIKHALKP